MGTNFYWIQDKCDHCDQQPEPIHIGKSSAGWCFLLHVIPEKGINSLGDWIKKLESGGHIEDEYDDWVTIAELMDRITKRKGNLQRHPLDKSHVHSHGEGTWDCLLGDFS